MKQCVPFSLFDDGDAWYKFFMEFLIESRRCKVILATFKMTPFLHFFKDPRVFHSTF
jgi:hypothetical protein